MDLRFVVITKNSARWLNVILDAYEALAIRPFIMVDDSSSDDTEGLLKRRNIEHAKVRADAPRVESIVQLIPNHVHSKWVIRLDDDELPSRGLRDWVGASLEALGRDVVGFQRRWIRRGPDGRYDYSQHPLILSRYGALDAQWRAFRPDAMRYIPDIHTPGFEVPPGSPIAPRKAYIAHFSWLVRSAHERRLQIDDYDRQEHNAGTRFRDIKVWEDADPTSHCFRAMDSDEFDRIAAALSATF